MYFDSRFRIGRLTCSAIFLQMRTRGYREFYPALGRVQVTFAVANRGQKLVDTHIRELPKQSLGGPVSLLRAPLNCHVRIIIRVWSRCASLALLVPCRTLKRLRLDPRQRIRFSGSAQLVGGIRKLD